MTTGQSAKRASAGPEESVEGDGGTYYPRRSARKDKALPLGELATRPAESLLGSL